MRKQKVVFQQFYSLRPKAKFVKQILLLTLYDTTTWLPCIIRYNILVHKT